MSLNQHNILSLDIGVKRIGLALVKKGSFIVKPLDYIIFDNDFSNKLQGIINQFQIDYLVIGLPRNQSGELTVQSKFVENFVEQHLKSFDLPIFYQDESLTSVLAQENLKNNYQYQSGSIDSESACLILEDYLNNLS